MTPYEAFLEGLALSRKVERCQREAFLEDPRVRRGRHLSEAARRARADRKAAKDRGGSA